MLPEPNCKWLLVFSGGQRSYQCFRAQCSLSCHQNLSQRQVKHHSAPLHGQLYNCCSRKQQRGNPFPSASRPDSRTKGEVPSKINSDHCSAPTRQTQQRGRQRVESFMTPANGNRPPSDSALPKKVQCRSLCITPNGSPPNLCQLETMPGCYLHRCNDPRLVPSKRLHLSTIQSDRTSTEESISGQNRSGACGPSVASATLVASTPERLDPESCHDPKLQTPAEESCIPSDDAPNVPQASFSHLSLIREQHQTEGFSEDFTRIL